MSLWHKGLSHVHFPQSARCPSLYDLSTHFNVSSNVFFIFYFEQIKEAADIIQKLHLIAQELPFDR